MGGQKLAEFLRILRYNRNAIRLSLQRKAFNIEVIETLLSGQYILLTRPMLSTALSICAGGFKQAEIDTSLLTILR